MGDMEIEWNEDGLAEFERQVKDQLSGDVEVPLDGSEDDAIRSVIQQLQSKGLTTKGRAGVALGA
jgi:hypothetical protein